MYSCRNSHIDYFMDTHTIYIYDTIIKTMYIYCQSIVTSIIIFNRVSNNFINCIVIGFNNGVIMIIINITEKCMYYCWLSFMYSLMVYLLFIAWKSRIHDIIQWIKQYSNDLKNKFLWNRSENDAKCIT